MTNSGKPAKTGREKSEFLWGWLFILPTVIGLIILNIIPIFQTIYQSFFKTGDFGKGNIFVGFENYSKVFGDSEVWQSLINSFYGNARLHTGSHPPGEAAMHRSAYQNP